MSLEEKIKTLDPKDQKFVERFVDNVIRAAKCKNERGYLWVDEPAKYFAKTDKLMQRLVGSGKFIRDSWRNDCIKSACVGSLATLAIGGGVLYLIKRHKHESKEL